MIKIRNLRRAIKTGDIKQVTEILRAAPGEDVRLIMGWTPLHVAVKGGNKDVVAAIIETGAPINATTEMHQTPLDLALKHDQSHIAKFLRQKGACLGAELNLHAAAAAGDLKEVRKHIAADSDIDQLNNGERPLGIALAYNRWSWILVLFIWVLAVAAN